MGVRLLEAQNVKRICQISGLNSGRVRFRKLNSGRLQSTRQLSFRDIT